MSENWTLKLISSSLFIMAVSLGVSPSASATVRSNPKTFSSFPSPINLPFGVDGAIRQENLRCMKATAPADSELTAEIAAMLSGTRIDYDFLGFKVVQEDSALVRAFTTLILDQDGRVPLSVIEGFRALPSPPVGVIDAAQKLLGQREGLQLLYLLMKYRINASHYQSPKAIAWTSEKLDEILLILSDLPPHLVPLPFHPYAKQTGFFPLIRRAHGIHIGSQDTGWVLADSFMTVYDKWEEKSPMSRRYALLHEIGHNLQYIIPDKQVWTNLSPWPATITTQATENDQSVSKTVALTTSYAGNLPEPFVSIYSKASPGEDFAESFAAYRYAPQWLLERNPEKYTYMKEVLFAGLEYTSDESCVFRPSNPLNSRGADILAAYGDYQIAQKDGSDLIGDPVLGREIAACSISLIHKLGDLNTSSAAIDSHAACVSRVAIKKSAAAFESTLYRFPKDTLAIRAEDSIEKATLPEMGTTIQARTGKRVRYSVESAYYYDYVSYLAENALPFQTCGGNFGALFSNWITTDMLNKAGRSVVVKSKLHDVSTQEKANAVAAMLARVCEKAISLRDPAVLTQQRASLSIAPLTTVEFWYGINQVFEIGSTI